MPQHTYLHHDRPFSFLLSFEHSSIYQRHWVDSPPRLPRSLKGCGGIIFGCRRANVSSIPQHSATILQLRFSKPFADVTSVSSTGVPNMFTQLLAPLLSLAILASASSPPVVMQIKPTVGDWCARMGGYTIANLNNFTLSAWNPAGNNPNTTGVPLVLSATGSTGGSSTHTWAVSSIEETGYATKLMYNRHGTRFRTTIGRVLQ